MQLHFIKQFPWGEPTYFIEKIWNGIVIPYFIETTEEDMSLEDFIDAQLAETDPAECYSFDHYKKNFPYDYDWSEVTMNVKPKIHTIRDDVKNRWHPGKDIHFMQWIGKGYRSPCYHFAPVIPCVSVQQFDILYDKDGSISVYVDDNLFYYQTSFNESDRSCRLKMEQLAINDGFASISYFFKFFNTDYSGKIIHWTDLKY